MTAHKSKMLFGPAVSLITGALLMACAPTHANVEQTAEAKTSDVVVTVERKDGENGKAESRVWVQTTDSLDGNAFVIAGDHGTRVYERRMEANKAARKSIKKAIIDLEERVKDADGVEKEALMEAIESLHETLKELDEETHVIVEVQDGHELGDEEQRIIIREAINDIKEEQRELVFMRKEITRELADARLEIEEAIGELEIEMSEGGETIKLHIDALKDAKIDLEINEEQQLEQLKRAEEELKSARKRLEARLKVREAEKARQAKKAEQDAQGAQELL